MSEALLAAIRPDDLELIQSPDFQGQFSYWDWRSYIPEETRLLWPHLSLELRAVLFYAASRQCTEDCEASH